ncbi:thioredoxin domain-containing protein [Chamaesiphon sp.]|uniref:DsbA family protein n=1 Tax=Chamaesiphon sp. TaxID=2814140 RepID=UPI0035933FC9
MNYLLTLWRFPILSLVLSSCLLGSLPAQAETIAATNSNPIKLSSPTQIPVSERLLAQSVKVSPQLEKQILEVLRRNPEVMFEVLQKYAIEQQAKDQKAQAEALKQARKNTKALIGDAPVMGANARQIVMVAFSDFQCPYCATADKSVKQFMAKHRDKVTLVYKYFPLTQIHPEALPAARAAWAANKQGKFWEYHDALFANQAKLGENLYLETATSLKLNLTKFNADRKIADDFIVEDFKLGRKLGIDGTPTFIMNGEVLSGATSLADLEKALAQVTQK